MSFYRQILSVQSPFDIGADKNERIMFSTNYDAVATSPVADFEREIGKLINNAGLGTFGTNMFIGTEAILPSGDGPYISLINTGGAEPEAIHNDSSAHTYENHSMQIVVRAKTYNAARDRALAIWRLLDGIHNTAVTA